MTASAVKIPRGREPDHRQLRPRCELLDQGQIAARLESGRFDRGGEPGCAPDQRQPYLALPVRRLDDARRLHDGQRVPRRHHPPPRLRHARLVEPLALAHFVDRQHRRLRRQRMRQSGALGDPRRQSDRPVGSRRDQPLDAEGSDEPVDRSLILRRQDAAPIGETEAGRGGVPVDDGEPDPASASRLEQPELCRPCA